VVPCQNKTLTMIRQNRPNRFTNGRPKTKSRFSRLLRHPVWKGEGLFWLWHFIDNYPLTYSPGTHTGHAGVELVDEQ